MSINAISSMSAPPFTKVLTLDTINPKVHAVEYAVRGRLAIRSEEIREELKNGNPFPFEKVVSCNIGNPQQLNQKPISFFRQVASLCENTDLLKDENQHLVSQLYPSDAIARARQLIKDLGSIGAYSHSQGALPIRRTVARFIEERDGCPANPNHIFMTQGASAGVQAVVGLLNRSSTTGFMIPIPQYPLYSATLTHLGAVAVPYYLEEESNWTLNISHLKSSVTKARKEGTDVCALVIINPGNPTGQCLLLENMRDIISFCHEERLVLLADEVYQTNIYTQEKPFISFRKALIEHPNLAIRTQLELISFHSISKGMVGECGRRGGYYECFNVDEEIIEQVYKMASVSLCANLHGQIMVDLMCNPPRKGDVSYDTYTAEITNIYESLKRRAKKLETMFNSMEGVTCQRAEGAMYLFPRIRLPQKAVEKAAEVKLAADAFYCEAMLEATGVCVVPGSGFGQEEGTWHFRSTFLPEEHLFDDFCANLCKFHTDFLAKYQD
ncbi:pyridoxal phosphate-dependent transferase [Spinellus fusiger]|nr:pyridoxal phosphate-dependent transferase [Spinellus fusiger]